MPSFKIFLSCYLCPGCQVISMGRGQESQARRAVTQTMVQGGWVVLQNGHFCTDYLMEALGQITSSDTVHGDFRLWVTSESSSQFPANFLQVSSSRSTAVCFNQSINQSLVSAGSSGSTSDATGGGKGSASALNPILTPGDRLTGGGDAAATYSVSSSEESV